MWLATRVVVFCPLDLGPAYTSMWYMFCISLGSVGLGGSSVLDPHVCVGSSRRAFLLEEFRSMVGAPAQRLHCKGRRRRDGRETGEGGEVGREGLSLKRRKQSGFVQVVLNRCRLAPIKHLLPLSSCPKHANWVPACGSWLHPPCRGRFDCDFRLRLPRGVSRGPETLALRCSYVGAVAPPAEKARLQCHLGSGKAKLKFCERRCLRQPAPSNPCVRLALTLHNAMSSL